MLLAGLAVVSAAGTAEARPAPEPAPASRPVPRGRCPVPVRWSSSWGRYGLLDGLLTAGSGVTILTGSLLGPGDTHHLRGGVLLDDSARDALRLPREAQRRLARDISDAMLYAALSYPFLVDAFGYTAWYRGSADVAWQMALVDVETLAIVEAVRVVFNVAVSRERPYGRECGSNLPNAARDCDSRARYYSFFSGHSSQTFASAALTCSHHLNLHLYGGGWADALPCMGGFVLAATTATLRVAGDQHYLSDVVVGAVWGTAAGFLIPWIARYHGPAAGAARSSTSWLIVPAPNGAAVTGTF